MIHSHETQRDKERRDHTEKGQEVLVTFLDCGLGYSDTSVMHARWQSPGTHPSSVNHTNFKGSKDHNKGQEYQPANGL
jgi:D-arabinose 1-dehydrogenase-like Zn-dependent alcohol dehydrogenase